MLIDVLLSEFQNFPPREINQNLNYIATNVRFVPNLETILSNLKTIGRTFRNQHIQRIAVDWIAPTNIYQITGIENTIAMAIYHPLLRIQS